MKSQEEELSRYPQVAFYIPKASCSNKWPQHVNDNWVSFGGGANIWVYYTAIALRDGGLAVDIVTELPDSGIVITHSRYLPNQITPRRDRMVVCIRADYGRKYSADLHVVQNSYQVCNRGREMLEWFFLPGPNYYVPQWPQPGLIPRSTERGDRFETVTFFGARQNLADDLLSDEFAEDLARQGIRFEKVLERGLWHDYSQVDAVLAVRPKHGDHHSRKPPSKLTNAWLAGVPAILGPDSAFRELRHSALDYLEVADAKEARAAILRLRDDLTLRRQMVGRGHQRAADYSHDANLARWKAFLFNCAIPLFEARQRTGEFAFALQSGVRRFRMALKA